MKWNLLHGFGAMRLPAVVGLGNAMMMLLSAEFIDAEEALRIGLVNQPGRAGCIDGGGAEAGADDRRETPPTRCG